MKSITLAGALVGAVFAGMFVSQVETQTGTDTVQEAEAAIYLGSDSGDTTEEPDNCWMCDGSKNCERITAGTGNLECGTTATRTGKACFLQGETCRRGNHPGEGSSWIVIY